MADNTAISAKKKMHMLLNERDRLSAYRCRIHDVVTDKTVLMNATGMGKEVIKRNVVIQSILGIIRFAHFVQIALNTE